MYLSRYHVNHFKSIFYICNMYVSIIYGHVNLANSSE